MLKLIIAWISIMTSGALAQSLSDVEKRAVNELSGEMLECSAYFLVSATCLQGSLDPSTPQITKNLNEQGAKFGELAINTGRIVGMTDAAVGARAELIRADMMKARALHGDGSRQLHYLISVQFWSIDAMVSPR
jgi:hypothetical protein